MHEHLYFGIYAEGHRSPMAIFAAIEDAMDWASEHFGSNTFRIKQCLVPIVLPDDQRSDRPD